MAATDTATVAPLLQATRTVPIVFVTVVDPVGAGFVGVAFQLVNVTIPKPEQKSHSMLKTDNSRTDIAQRRGNTFNWRMM